MPVLAVTRIGGQTFVYVAAPKGNGFAAHQVAVDLGDLVGNTYPVNNGLKLKPSFAKNALLRWRSATGMFTNSMRPGCAGVVTVGLQSLGRWRTSW